MYRKGWVGLGLLLLLVGCDRGPEVVPVTGKVTYNGDPLPYGSVLFQPSSGQPAGGVIQSDGTFRLSTFAEYDGAIVGGHKISVSCYTSHSPTERAKKQVGEFVFGDPLIPKKYAYVDSSGLNREVKSGEENAFTLELEGPKARFPK